jgi:2-dehydropantoate 2-reductase
MVLVKSHQTASVNLPAERLVLTVQNGLGNVERLCEAVGSRNVLAGSTSEAAIREEDGYVRHVASGKTVFGPWTSADPEPARLALERAGFDAEITPAPGQAIWEKATLNSGINPLTALLNMPNGALVEVPEVRQLMRDLVVEAVKVATLEGYRFEYSLVEAAEDLCRATADNISSMLQDVRAGRKTEIDALSGELLRRGQASGLPMPRTRVVYQLIRGLEERQAAD